MQRRPPRTPDNGTEKIADYGNLMVTFSQIGACLYIVSILFGIDYDRFLMMVFLFGSAIIASRPGFNPQWSDTLHHDLSADQLRCFKAFVAKRNKLHSAEGETARTTRQEAFDDLGAIYGTR